MNPEPYLLPAKLAQALHLMEPAYVNEIAGKIIIANVPLCEFETRGAGDAEAYGGK